MQLLDREAAAPEIREHQQLEQLDRRVAPLGVAARVGLVRRDGRRQQAAGIPELQLPGAIRESRPRLGEDLHRRTAHPAAPLGQPATLFTDAGGAGLPGTVSFISPKAEFTPRNVQTAEERSKLVYRIKISVDNTQGVLKQGMPVEADVPLSAK